MRNDPNLPMGMKIVPVAESDQIYLPKGVRLVDRAGVEFDMDWRKWTIKVGYCPAEGRRTIYRNNWYVSGAIPEGYYFKGRTPRHSYGYDNPHQTLSDYHQGTLVVVDRATGAFIRML